MEIVTGATGTLHVTSNNDGEFNQGIWGEGAVILQNGNQLTATIVDNNTIRISDGNIIFQGRHGLIEPNTTEDIRIDTGASGQNRIDLICVRYSLNNGVESMELIVKKGTPTTGTPVPPSYTTGVIRTGATIAEIPLYSVRITGINIVSLTKMITVMPYMSESVKKQAYGTSLPPVEDYNEGDIFFLIS